MYISTPKGLISHVSSFLQEVKDRISLRGLEKMISQLADSKEQAELLSPSALQPLDVNTDGTHAISDSLLERQPDIQLSIYTTHTCDKSSC